MSTTVSSGRSGRQNREKNSSKANTNQVSQSVQNTKTEGPPNKVQATAEQIRIAQLTHVNSESNSAEDAELQKKIKQIMELTGCSQEKVEIALYDNKNDMDRAANQLLEGEADQGEWRETGGKKKKKTNTGNKSDGPPLSNHVNEKSDKQRDSNKERRDKERERDKEKDEQDGEKEYKTESFRRPRRNDNRPPRLSRGRGRPDRAGDRADRDGENAENERDDSYNRERGFDRGRGRGRGLGGPRRGRGGGGFRPNSSRFDKGPQIDTWTNETAENAEKEKITSWGDTKTEDWSEDIDSWTGGLAESKVFTASAVQSTPPQVEHSVPVPMNDTSNTLSNTFDFGALLQKNDMNAEANYISQFNQQATESIKNTIGIGSTSNQSLSNSLTSVSSQTASNVSALVSLTQTLHQDHDSIDNGLSGAGLTGSSLTSNGLSAAGLTPNGLDGSGLTGNGLGRSGLPVSSLTGSGLSGASLPVNSLTGGLNTNSLTGAGLNSGSLTGTGLNSNSLSGTGFSGNSLTGSGLQGTSLSGNISVSQSISAPSVSQASTVSQNAMLQQQRPKAQRTKLPPPSKIPASAVEMPGHSSMMTTLDVQFGFEVKGREERIDYGASAFSSTAANSSTSSTMSNHVSNQVPVSSESVIPTSIMSASPAGHVSMSGLEQTSPRGSNPLYQPSAYTTPPKKDPSSVLNNSNKLPPSEPIPLPPQNDLKSTPMLGSQRTGSVSSSLPQVSVSLSPTNMDSEGLNSFATNSSTYQNSGYQSHKSYSSHASGKTGSYPGNQFQSGSSQSQTGSNQYQSSHNQYQSSQNQYQTGQNQFQSPPHHYQTTQQGFQSTQSQFPGSQSQFQNFQTGSTFQNQSNYPSNSANQSSLYQGSSTPNSYPSQSPQSSLYPQTTTQSNSFSSQSGSSYLRDTTSGPSFQTSVTQSSSSPFKDNQPGSYRDTNSVPSSFSVRDGQSSSNSYRDTQSVTTSYTRDSQSGGSSYNRESQSGTPSYRESQSGSSGYRDNQSGQGSYNRDSHSGSNTFRDNQSGASSYQRDGQTGSTAYPRDTQSGSSYQRDSQATGSFQRDVQAGSSSFQRDVQSNSTSYPNQTGASSFQRDSQSSRGSGSSQGQSSFGKNFGSTSGVLPSSNLQTSPLASGKLSDNLSKMSVKDSSQDQPAVTQFDSAATTSKPSSTTTTTGASLTSTTNTTASTASVPSVSSKSSVPSSSSAATKTTPSLPPGVPLMGHQYIMGQGTLPYFAGLQGLQQPLYATNFEDLQFLQQRLPTLPANNYYDMSAAGLPVPTTLTGGRDQPNVPTVPYSGAPDTSKMNRVEAQSPIPTSQQSGAQSAHQQPYIHLNYGYFYPPSVIPGATGFQYPMIPMPQVTNTAHAGGTPANSQYQKNFGSHHMPYGGNKVYDEVNQTPDYSKSPYGGTQAQAKGTAGTSVTSGTASSDIGMPGYGKTHAQGFDKQGFHAGTPPPFNLQLATGNQAGPLAGPANPYGAPFVPMMPHQPHSQMMHHPLQDNSTTSRGGSQQIGSQPKTAAKNYGTTYWNSS